MALGHKYHYIYPLACAPAIAISNIFFIAGSRSSNNTGKNGESRSTPKVNCVRSLEPIEIHQNLAKIHQ